MRILALEREPPLPLYQEFRDLLHDEAAAIWALQKSGVIREIWFTQPRHHAVIMLEAASVAAARAHLATLPLVRADLSDFTVIELCNYDGLERLFARHLEAAPRREEPPEY